MGESSVCEELALDAAGCVVADSIVERPRGWTILRPLLASLDRAAWQRVGVDRGGWEWHRVVSKYEGLYQVECNGNTRIPFRVGWWHSLWIVDVHDGRIEDVDSFAVQLSSSR